MKGKKEIIGTFMWKAKIKSQPSPRGNFSLHFCSNYSIIPFAHEKSVIPHVKKCELI